MFLYPCKDNMYPDTQVDGHFMALSVTIKQKLFAFGRQSNNLSVKKIQDGIHLIFKVLVYVI